MADERPARLARIREHTPDLRSLFLALDRPLVFRPGHFVSCRLPVGGDVLTRAYSIASHPDGDAREIELLLDRVPGGPGSTYLFGLTAGDAVSLSGPWGTFVLDAQPEAETVFVADGTGIAPIRPMVRRACMTGRHPIRLLYGTRPATPVVYADELDVLAGEHPRFTWEPVPTEQLEVVVGRRYVQADGERDRHLFVCGVGDRVRRLRRLLRDAGYARRAVLCERW